MNNGIKLVPELRFPEFVNGGEWEEKSLEKVVKDFIVPMRDKPKKLDGEIPWCRIEDFNGMYLSASKSNQGVSFETIKEMNLKIYPVNTLLVSCSADLGRCAITQKPLVTNQTFIGLVPDIKKINTVYLYYVMTNSSNELNARSSGTTISYLSRQQFEKFEIRLPNLKEQQKIASCLSSLDELITAYKKKLEAFKDHKKGLMQNLFPEEGEKVPKYRFKEFKNAGDWRKKKLKEVCEVNPSNKGLPENFIYIDLESVDAGILKQKRHIILGEAPSRAQRLLKKGDVIFQMVRPYQQNNYYFLPNDDSDYVASTGYAQLRAHESGLFLYQYLHNQTFLGRVLAKCTGSNYPAINSSDLSEIPILIPTKIHEQQQIASCLFSLDALITAQAEKIEQLKLGKKGLMQGLFPKMNA